MIAKKRASERERKRRKSSRESSRSRRLIIAGASKWYLSRGASRSRRRTQRRHRGDSISPGRVAPDAAQKSTSRDKASAVCVVASQSGRQTAEPPERPTDERNGRRGGGGGVKRNQAGRSGRRRRQRSKPTAWLYDTANRPTTTTASAIGQ